VLQELQLPIQTGAVLPVWETVDSKKLFVKLLDYSRGRDGKPGPDQSGDFYVVTELASYSLRDYISRRRRNLEAVTKAEARHLVRTILIIVAGLHAKGLVHLDLKPENFMVFNGRLKLIDVDGCVRIGAKLLKSDASISYSPCFCAPEFAQFVASPESNTLRATTGHDVWSVGMIIIDFVSSNSMLATEYRRQRKEARSESCGHMQFLSWLSRCAAPPVPYSIKDLDMDLWELLTDGLCAIDPKSRPSMLTCLAHPFINGKGDNDHSIGYGVDTVNCSSQSTTATTSCASSSESNS